MKPAPDPLRRPAVPRSAAAIFGAIALLVSTACNDYLSGPGKDQDPNNVQVLTQAGPIYLSLQTAQAVQFEGGLARIAGMYSQQIAGPGRQQQSVDLYQSQPTDIDNTFSSVYTSGGLIDARTVQSIARSRGDSTTAGIGEVYEALIIGTAASFWGDIPYSQANTPGTTPAFDPQQKVYADVEAKLDDAIKLLSATGRTNSGPGQFELVFGGASASRLRTLYKAVAYTLKARYYLHLAERDASNYALALAAAQNGIKDGSGASDMNWYNADNANSQNIFYQFQSQRGDLGPGAALVNLMKSRVSSKVDTPDRLAFYFLDYCSSQGATAIDPTDPASYYGYRPAGDANLPGGGGAPATAVCDKKSAQGSYSDFNFLNGSATGTQTFPGFRSPVVTYAENQLILAEAAFNVSGGGGAGVVAAQPYLDGARANQVYGATVNGPMTFPSQSTIPATLRNIMEEKYIDLFLNTESWSDFKRTCFPYLAPAPTNATASTPGTKFVRRVPYGLNEINTNPNAKNTDPFTPNYDDPNACPALNYTSGTPIAY